MKRFLFNKERDLHQTLHPFWVIVKKEVADHISSWRFLILVFIILLTCLASLYTSLSTIRAAAASVESATSLFLNIYTLADQERSLPPFITFITFLGPLLGIGLGFDAVNAERNKGTLTRIISQPISRDYFIIAKFTAAIFVISLLVFTLGFLVMGLGIFSIGLPPSFDEFLRIATFLLLSIVYIAFWLSLAIFFSIRFRQAATSALSSLAVWLFFSLFYSMIVSFVSTSFETSNHLVIQLISRFNPSYLYSEITTILLTPSIRTTGPVTMEQVVGAIPSPLPYLQSLLLVSPQVVGLIAATMICFALSYIVFMRQEIRA